jgi:cell division protein FtsB
MKAPRITGSTIVNVLGSAAALYLVTVLAQTVHRNYQLGNQIDELKAQISLVQAQKIQLSNTIQYYQTDSFHDRDARSKLGLQLPGENVVIVPHSSAAPAGPKLPHECAVGLGVRRRQPTQPQPTPLVGLTTGPIARSL